HFLAFPLSGQLLELIERRRVGLLVVGPRDENDRQHQQRGNGESRHHGLAPFRLGLKTSRILSPRLWRGNREEFKVVWVALTRRAPWDRSGAPRVCLRTPDADGRGTTRSLPGSC